MVVELRGLGVLDGGRALAVVAGDEGDELDLVVGEAGQPIRVPDDVVRVLVVLAVGHEEPHVREQGAGLEELAVVPDRPSLGSSASNRSRAELGDRAPSARGRRPSARRGGSRCAGAGRAGRRACRRGSARACRAALPRAGRSR